jgi:hypothetical protein
VITFNFHRLSDSRFLFIGALAADVPCMGSLAIFLYAPRAFEVWPVSKILLAGIAITAPVLMLGAFLLLNAARRKVPMDTRARRAALAAAVAHGSAQISLVGDSFLAGRVHSLKGYLGLSALYVLGVCGTALWLLGRRRRKQLRRLREVRRHRLTLRRQQILAEQIQ